MIAAFTTAAVINYSLYRPSEAVQPKDFMPNYGEPVKAVPGGDQIDEEVLADYRSKRAHICALLQQYQVTGEPDPYLIEIGLVAAKDKLWPMSI